MKSSSQGEPFLQLIYTSQPGQGLLEETLIDILRQAQVYNTKNQISGFLVANQKNLIQLIEGREKDVRPLFKVIRQDPRHHHIEIQHEAFSSRRCMPFLGMGLCFTYLIEDLDHQFYFTKEEARKFNELIEGDVGEIFKHYLV